MNMFLYLYLLCGSRDTHPPFLRFLSCSWAFQEIPDAWLVPNLPSGTLPWRLTQLWLPVGPALQPYTQKVLGAGQSPREPPPHVHSPSEPRPRALRSMARACCFNYGRILLASTISWTCAPRLRVLSTEAGWTHRLSRPRAETPVSFLDQGCLALPHSSRVLGETLLSIFTPKSGIGLRDDYKVRWEGWVNQKFWVRKNASQLHVSTESLANNASSRKNNFPAGNLVSPADGHGGEHPAGPPGHLDTMDPWDELT